MITQQDIERKIAMANLAVEKAEEAQRAARQSRKDANRALAFGGLSLLLLVLAAIVRLVM